MAPRIEPALSEAEWATLREHEGSEFTQWVMTCRDRGDYWPIVAAANYKLDRNDPRKITREKVDALRSASRLDPDLLTGYGVPLRELADALQSILAPED